MRGITTRMGPLGVEDDEDEDEELIDITFGAQLDPRSLFSLLKKSGRNV